MQGFLLTMLAAALFLCSPVLCFSLSAGEADPAPVSVDPPAAPVSSDLKSEKTAGEDAVPESRRTDTGGPSPAGKQSGTEDAPAELAAAPKSPGRELRTIGRNSAVAEDPRIVPDDGNSREVWTGSVYSSTFRIAACVKPDGQLSGVLFLQLANGDTDTYHVNGTYKGSSLRARHHSGHSFKGKLKPDKVTGVITLKNGLSIELSGKRWRDAGVPEEDACF